ncbi:MAG: DNA-directed RNA polymerase subunit D [Candidatus Altiarchaeota archaeon]|nr:DNA-directed RNA polymerase subunit D [Candidatus Altiarchaeota archaeon]
MIEAIKEGKEPVSWIRFKIKAPVSFVNALRRVITTEVPVLSIEDINLVKNNSVVYDEMLGLRLGLIPIRADPENYMGKKNFKVAFVLKGEGPGTLYSRDLQPMDPEIIPAFPDIPLVKMVDGQAIELEAWAIVGTAKEHSKWQAGHAFYKQLNEETFEFYAESFGAMPARQLVIMAAEIIEAKGEDFGKWVDKQ